MNPSTSSYDETLRTYQQESREMREAHKRTKAHLNDLTELLHKFATQMAVKSQPPSSSNPLPSQPLPNSKGGINVVQTANDKDAIIEKEEDDEEEEDEEDDDWLYDLLAKLVGVDSDSEDEYEDAEEEETTKEDEEEEMIGIIEEATEKEESSTGGNEEKPEDLLEKCADPGPYFVTCKIGKVYVPDCLCDPGACAGVMPLELHRALDLGPLKRTTDTFHLDDTKPQEITMGAINPQVLLGRQFLKTQGLKLNFYDETFSLEVGNVIEIFQPTRPPIPQEESVHQARKEESVGEIKQKETADPIVTPKQKKEQKTPTPARRSKQKKEDTKEVN
ncbi:hypothetical protein PIB30_102740 [Stylosanthes scabra]|uniref:Uncharacterized protein n=1 Tax=Stylosanthes scabra TaxID=79078 RepID=A0ABU6YWS2_9FABA|nr:hypothetical protein [Stylosanthes scabra]